jgi:hypothetical protein
VCGAMGWSWFGLLWRSQAPAGSCAVAADVRLTRTPPLLCLPLHAPLFCVSAAMQEANAAIAAKRMAEPQRQPEPEPEPSSDEAEEGAAESQPQPPGACVPAACALTLWWWQCARVHVGRGERASTPCVHHTPPIHTHPCTAPHAPTPHHTAARRIVPGASDELTAVRKPKAAKAVVKHVTELPDIPDYEYRWTRTSLSDHFLCPVSSLMLEVGSSQRVVTPHAAAHAIPNVPLAAMSSGCCCTQPARGQREAAGGADSRAAEGGWLVRAGGCVSG